MALSFVTKFFPVPAFMTLQGVGVHVTDRFVRAIAVDQAPGELTLVYEKALESTPFDSGRTLDFAHLGLRQALVEIEQKSGFDYLAVSAPENVCYIYETTVESDLPDNKIEQHIEQTIEGVVPLPLDQLQFDWQTVYLNEKKGKRHLSITAIEKQYVDTAISFCDDVGMTAASFDSETRAVARASIPATDTGTHIVLQIAADQAVIMLCQGNVIRYAHTIRVAAEASQDRDKVTKTERKKQLAVLLEGIERVREYHRRNVIEGVSTDSDLLISAEGVPDAWFMDQLAEASGLRVTMAHPWHNLVDFNKAIPSLTKAEAMRYAAAAGLACNVTMTT